MANIRLKNIKELSSWNEKELRKLRMTVRNRISSFESASQAKELPEAHPLSGMSVTECNQLLDQIISTEKNLRK